MPLWHTMDQETTLSELGTKPSGLSQQEIEARLARYGPNRIEESRTRSPLQVLVGQFTEIMVIVLLVAAAISGQSRTRNEDGRMRPSTS